MARRCLKRWFSIASGDDAMETTAAATQGQHRRQRYKCTQVICGFQHLAASKGYEDITLFLIQEGVDLNADDNFGNTPLLEAIKNGHDRVAYLLSKEGALLKINNAGSFFCTVVSRGDSYFLRRLLSNGVDPNSNDYDHHSPLHVAASQGLYLMAKLLVEAGSSVLRGQVACGKRAGAFMCLLDEMGRYDSPEYQNMEFKPDYEVSSLVDDHL